MCSLCQHFNSVSRLVKYATTNTGGEIKIDRQIDREEKDREMEIKMNGLMGERRKNRAERERESERERKKKRVGRGRGR